MDASNNCDIGPDRPESPVGSMRLRSKDADRGPKDPHSQESHHDMMQNGLAKGTFIKEGHEDGARRGVMKDKSNILLLVFLYVLQGIPLGLAGSMPMVLQKTGITYKQQAMFSLVFWPFSLKLLWAPIVDSLYIRALGRRKTWLVPTQYLIGVFMLLLSLVSFSIYQYSEVIFICSNGALSGKCTYTL